jgi:hypothetical protein
MDGPSADIMQVYGSECKRSLNDRSFSHGISWKTSRNFILKLKDEGISHENDLRRSLKQRYDIDVPIKTIREVLSIIG